jgi:photosystem II stability/assembly factor-like uncharacterized protein
MFYINNPLVAQWVETSGLHVYTINDFAVSGNNIFAGTNDGVFISTNGGRNWNRTGLSSIYINALTTNGENIFAGVGIQRSVFLSTDQGANWNAVDTGLTDLSVLDFAFSDSIIFVGTGNGGVCRSTNNGLSWSAANTGLPQTIRPLVINGTNLLAGCWGNGIYQSSDNGDNWTILNVDLNNVYTMAVSGSKLFVGTWGSGVFLSTIEDPTFRPVNTGLTSMYITCLAVIGGYLFAGTDNGVWMRPLSELMSEVENNEDNTPTHFALEQNFPNPFNPTTKISFSIPSKSFVSLKIFDYVGREVATLVSEELFKCNYEKQWSPTGLASGVLFYRLQIGLYLYTKKLILLK